jgi:hypothetical protein
MNSHFKKARRLRREIARAELRSDGRRVFCPDLRERVLAWVDEGKASGMREAQCGRELGLAASYFTAWRRAREQTEADCGARAAKAPREMVPFTLPLEMVVEPISRELVPIEMPASISVGTGLVFVTTSGHRVEGLNLEQAYALLREFVCS